MTLMASFSDLNGVPATANDFLMREVLRDEWSFDGFVVSDWDSVRQLAIHGLTESDEESVFQAVSAGVDMEMAGASYSAHLVELVENDATPFWIGNTTDNHTTALDDTIGEEAQ